MSKICPFSGKVTYKRCSEAKAYASNILRFGRRQFAYRCGNCGGWHLTSTHTATGKASSPRVGAAE